MQEPVRPVVSVIVPMLPSMAEMHDVLSSVIAQRRVEFEVVVVELGDSWGDPGVMAQDRSGRVRVVRVPGRSTMAAARNAGLRAARGEYIAYLEPGDRYYPNHLETMVSALSGREGIAYSDACLSHEIRRGGSEILGREAFPSEAFDRDRLLLENNIVISCVVHHRACVVPGAFDETLTCGEDWDLWIRLSAEQTFLHVQEQTCEICRIVEQGPRVDQLGEVLKAENRVRAKHRRRFRYEHQVYPLYAERINMLLDLDQEVALDALEDFVAFNLEHGGARRDLAYLYSMREEVARGVAVLRRPGVHSLEAQLVAEHRGRIEELAGEGNIDEAQKMQEGLLAACPTDGQGFNNLGVFAWMRGQGKKAHALLRLAAELEPSCIETHRNLARVCLSMGRMSEAMRHCRIALDLVPGDAEALQISVLIEKDRTAGLLPAVPDQLCAVG